MKIFTGKVISTSMQDTVVVEVVRRIPHPLYKKLLKRSNHFKAALGGHSVAVGQTVKIVETKKLAKDKYFKIAEIVEKSHTKGAKK